MKLKFKYTISSHYSKTGKIKRDQVVDIPDDLHAQHYISLGVAEKADGSKVTTNAETSQGLSTEVTAKEAIEVINGLKTIAEIDTYISGDERKGVTKAANEAKSLLSKSGEPNGVADFIAKVEILLEKGEVSDDNIQDVTFKLETLRNLIDTKETETINKITAEIKELI